MRGRPWQVDTDFKKSVAAHTEQIVKRAEVMGCKLERESVSAYLSLDFLSNFTSRRPCPTMD